MDNNNSASNKENAKDSVNNEKADDMNINVKSQDGNTICFKLRKTTLMKKLIDTYCNRIGQNSSSVRFIYDGERIVPTDTPLTLGMEDGDEVDAMVEQHGGTIY